MLDLKWRQTPVHQNITVNQSTGHLQHVAQVKTDFSVSTATLLDLGMLPEAILGCQNSFGIDC